LEAEEQKRIEKEIDKLEKSRFCDKQQFLEKFRKKE